MHGVIPQIFASCKAVTTSDTAQNAFSAFFCTGTGAIAFKGLDGVTVTLPAVPIYTIIPIQTSQILATGTAATGIFGLN